MSNAALEEIRRRLTSDEFKDRRPYIWLGQGFSSLLGFQADRDLGGSLSSFLEDNDAFSNRGFWSADGLFDKALAEHRGLTDTFFDFAFDIEVDKSDIDILRGVFELPWGGVFLDCFDDVVSRILDEQGRYLAVTSLKGLRAVSKPCYLLRPNYLDLSESNAWLMPFDYNMKTENLGLLKVFTKVLERNGLFVFGHGDYDDRLTNLIAKVTTFRKELKPDVARVVLAVPGRHRYEDVYDSIELELSKLNIERFVCLSSKSTASQEMFAVLKSAFQNHIPKILSNDDMDEFVSMKKLEATQINLPKYIEQFPESIMSVQVQNFKCIKELEIKLPHDGLSQWVLITGENGTGKTSLLQAIAGAFYFESELEHVFEREQQPVLYALALSQHATQPIHQACAWNKKYWEEPSGQQSGMIHIVGYGPQRMFRYAENTSDDEQIYKSAVQSLIKQRGELLNIEHWLKMTLLDYEQDVQPNGKAKIDAVLGILTEVMPNVDEIQLKGSHISYCFQGEEVRSFLLSSGQKNILGMIGDLIIRMYRYHPDVIDPKDFTGVVLIDEIENHLHPIWQVELPRMLSRIFPKLQFWATTHSALPFLGVPADSTFIRLCSEEEKGVTAEVLDLTIENLLPNTILTSPIFGMDRIVHRDNQVFADVLADDHYEDGIERQATQAALAALENEQLERLLEADDDSQHQDHQSDSSPDQPASAADDDAYTEEV